MSWLYVDCHDIRPGFLVATLQGEPGASPLVILLGMGGAGKTRLAIETARRLRIRYKVSVFFVALAYATRPAEIPEFIVGSQGLSLLEESAPE